MSDCKQLHDILISYLHKMESLREALPYLMGMSYVMRKKANARKSGFLEENGELISEDENGRSYKVELEHQRLVGRLDKKARRANTAYEVLPSKFLVAFVSEYDAFLGSLVKELYRLKPELLDGSERSLSFSDLKELASVEAAYEHILEKEVESLLRKSHSEQFDWLENKFSIPLRKELKSWSNFIELTERRNLLVHCDGAVSNQYLSVCKRHKADLADGVKIGDKLDTNTAYLKRSYRCLYEIGVKLTHVLWRKLFPANLNESDISLINVTYNLLHEEEYELAKCLLDFSVCTLKKWGSDSNRRVFVINRAQAYYHAGDFDKCGEILAHEDWTACGDQYQICVAALQKDYERAASLMKQIGSSGQITQADYIDWPVFRDFRETDEFINTFKEVFNKEPVDISKLVPEPEIEDVMSDDDQAVRDELLDLMTN